jgi:hypothetical protein
MSVFSESATLLPLRPKVSVQPKRVAELPATDQLSILILPDLHIPSSSPRQKQLLLDNRGFLDRHDWVVLLGDVTNCYGTASEYVHVNKFISDLDRPYSVVNGNHEFVFSPMTDGAPDFGSKWEHGTTEQQQRQMNRFNTFYGFETCYQAARHPLAGLILLGLDSIGPDDSGMMSAEHQEWLARSLANMRDLPILIFSHFPVQDDRLDNVRYYEPGRRPYYQPSPAVQRELESRRPPTFWFSGHVHFCPPHPLAKPYRTEMGIWQVHCPDARGYGRPHNQSWTPERYDGLFARSVRLEKNRLSIVTTDLISESECEHAEFDLSQPSQDCLLKSK